MRFEELFNEGIESFLTGEFTSSLHAISRYKIRLGKEERFEFSRGFKHAQDLFN